jgi:hypothetical protein
MVVKVAQPRANITRLVAIACLMLGAGATRADSQPSSASANNIMPGCKDWLARGHEDLLKQGDCFGKVQGVWDTATIFRAVCSPPAVTLDQSVRIVVQFIDARPVRMHGRFTTLALEALVAAWPCKK